MGEWPVASGVFRSRFKGPKRESRGGIFQRYPPHEPARAIVLACILRHVGATHDDIAHRKLPRWYEPFYYRMLRCGPRASGSLVPTAVPSPSFSQCSVCEGDIVTSPRNFARGKVCTFQTPGEKREKIASRVHRSEYAATFRFKPIRILRDDAFA